MINTVVKMTLAAVVFAAIVWLGMTRMDQQRETEEAQLRTSYLSSDAGVTPTPVLTVVADLPTPTPVSVESVPPPMAATETPTPLPMEPTAVPTATPVPVVPTPEPVPTSVPAPVVMAPTAAPMVTDTPTASPTPTDIPPTDTPTPTATPTIFLPPTATPTPTPLPTVVPVPRVSDALNGETRVVVLGYHRFAPPEAPTSNIYTIQTDVFDRQMAWLRDNGYQVVPLSDLVRFMHKEIDLPKKAVVITIDDGYRSAYSYAFPILKKYGYPWTFFVYTDFVSNGTSAVHWDELKEMQAAGVDVESHTKSHPFLTQKLARTDAEYDAWLQQELQGSRDLIQQKLGKPVTFLAYPYGDHNDYVDAKALQAGYQAMFTIAQKTTTRATPLTQIGRFVVTKENEDRFHSYLQQQLLTISATEPGDGTMTGNAHPVIKAVLHYEGTLSPASIVLDIENYGTVPVDYDPATGQISAHLPRALEDRLIRVRVKARDASSHELREVEWRFYYLKSDSNPLPVLPSN